MILLRPDCLVFRTTTGENIPCSVTDVTIELIGESAEWIDPELISNAAAAVLQYFRTEKQQESVSVAEFSDALERVLRGFGLDVKAGETQPAGQDAAPRVVEADLRRLAEESGAGSELFFFPVLRAELRRQLDGSPVVLRYHGLHGCAQSLVGAKRWTTRCQSLSDQIVDYLRNCLNVEQCGASCALVVS